MFFSLYTLVYNNIDFDIIGMKKRSTIKEYYCERYIKNSELTN